MKDKVILITGATGGIGSALSKVLAMQGAQCILLGRNISKLEKLYDEILTAEGKQPALYPVDFNGASVDDYAQLTDVIKKEFGRLDSIIHTAAIWKESTAIEQSDPKLWFETFNINLHAPYMLTRACIPLLKATENSSIIFTDHQIETDKTAHLGAFIVCKDALKSLANVLQNELDTPNTQVKVHIVSPGDIRSPMNTRIYPGINFSGKPAPENIVNRYIELIS